MRPPSISSLTAHDGGLLRSLIILCVYIFFKEKKLCSHPNVVFIMYYDYIVYIVNYFVLCICKHILYYVLYYFERRNKCKQTNSFRFSVTPPPPFYYNA